MDPNADLKPVIDGFCRALAGRGVRSARVFLFGSWSSGAQHDDSDIDLAGAVTAVRAPIEAVAFTPEEFEDEDRPIATFAKAGIEMDVSLALDA